MGGLRNALLISSILLVFLCPLVSAGEKSTISETWHPYHDFFTIGTDYYELRINHYTQNDEMLVKMMVKRNQGQTIISAMAPKDSEGEYHVRKPGCKTEGMLTYCIMNVSLDPDDGGRADESGEYHYGTKIRIVEEKPDEAYIDVIRTVRDVTLPYGKETKVTLTFKNKGTKTATNVSFHEELGPGVQAVRQEGFWNWNSKGLSATIPVIYIDEEKAINYYIKTVEYANSSTITGNLSYLAPTRKSTTVTSAITIPWPYTFTCVLAPTKIKPGEEATYACSLKNNDAVPLSATIDLAFPSFYYLKRYSGITARTPGAASAIVKELKPGETAMASLTFIHSLTGVENLSATTHVTVNDQEFSTLTKTALTIATDGVNPTISLSKGRARGSDPLTVGVYLTNTDKSIPYHNIQGSLQIGEETWPFTVNSLSSEEHKNALFITTTLPPVEGKVILPVMVNGTCYTPANELRTFSTKKEVTLFPQNASVLLTVTANPTSAQRGQNITVTVSGENVAESSLAYVEARDTLTLPVIFGTTNAETFLYGAEQKTLYVYQVRIPLDYTENQAVIMTSLTAKGQALSTTVTTIAVTNPYVPAPVVVQNVTPPEPEPVVEPTPVEEPKKKFWQKEDPVEDPVTGEPVKKEGNFFSRTVKAIADFFAGFLS